MDRQHKWSAELGERFVQFRPTPPDPEKVARKALLATAKEEEHRKAIEKAYRAAFAEATRLLRSPANDFQKVDAEAQRLAPELALFVAEARRPVHRDRYSRGKYEVLPPEGPGRLVKVLSDRVYQMGNHTEQWDGQDFSGRPSPTGTYLVRMETGDRVEARKVMLVR